MKNYRHSKRKVAAALAFILGFGGKAQAMLSDRPVTSVSGNFDKSKDKGAVSREQVLKVVLLTVAVAVPIIGLPLIINQISSKNNEQNIKKKLGLILENIEDVERESDYDPDAVINGGYYEFTDSSLKKYVLSDLDKVDVNGVNGDMLKNRLKTLCEKFSRNGYDYTKGWSTGEFTSDGGGEQAPWEYFFVKNNRIAYSGMWLANASVAAIAMDDAHKTLLAKEIILMRDHIDDPGWEDVICSCLVLMCTHGGQCAWRATSIVDNIYFALNQKAYEVTGKNTTIFDIVFSKLKHIIIDRSFVAMKKYMETGVNNNLANFDPLGYVNPVLAYLKFKLGISRNTCNGGWVVCGGDTCVDCAGHGEKLLKKEMCALRLFMLANRAMQEGVTEKQQNEAAPDVELSFEDYCKYTMKSENSKQKLLDAVADLKKISPDGMGAEEILPWINGRKKLSVLDIIANLGTWAGCKIKGNAKELHNYLYDIMPELKYQLGVRFIINCCKKNYLNPVC